MHLHDTTLYHKCFGITIPSSGSTHQALNPTKLSGITFVNFMGFEICFKYRIFLAVPVATRSKAWVCGRSLPEIGGSNLDGAWIWHSEDRASWCILIMKANEMHYFSNLFDKVPTCFGQVHCPSSGVSQHCIHAVGICHASSVGFC
jgi:hypothetical protein